MRLLTILAVGLLTTMACSKSGDRRQACEHMIDLAKTELEKSIAQLKAMDGDMDKFADELREKADASTKSDLDTCVAKMEEHGIDPGCINKADSLDEATACLRR